VQTMLDHILHAWADDDVNVYNYIVSWFAHKIQHPERKIGVVIVVKSITQGAGKGRVFEFFRSAAGVNVGCIEQGYSGVYAEVHHPGSFFHFGTSPCFEEIISTSKSGRSKT